MMVHPLFGPNKFKLGLFSINADGGLAITKVPERWRVSWPDILHVVSMAEEADMEFILPIARWKGFGGETDARGSSFETLAHAAALASVTKKIGIFATVHAPLVHPVFAAKSLATIDHVSNGRAGLNIVCGWNQPEFDMFGIGQADDRYAQGLEWYDILVRLLRGDPSFNFEGKYFSLKNVVGAPQSLQQPRPVTMSAAFSASGRDFAAQTSDFLFTTFAEIDSGAEHIRDIRARGKATGRDIGVFTTCHVVCRPTKAEAEEYYTYYAVDNADHEAMENHMALKKEFAHSHDRHVFDQYRKRFAGGAGTYPLIGSPREIVEEMIKMAAIGFAGTTLSFVNFRTELPYFIKEVMPLMREAGLRVS